MRVIIPAPAAPETVAAWQPLFESYRPKKVGALFYIKPRININVAGAFSKIPPNQNRCLDLSTSTLIVLISVLWLGGKVIGISVLDVDVKVISLVSDETIILTGSLFENYTAPFQLLVLKSCHRERWDHVFDFTAHCSVFSVYVASGWARLGLVRTRDADLSSPYVI